MPGDGADFVAINGPAVAAEHADQETPALLDLLLVSAL